GNDISRNPANILILPGSTVVTGWLPKTSLSPMPIMAVGRIPDKAPGTSESGPATVIYSLELGKSHIFIHCCPIIAC
ncbi:MAG: hypothetical protein WBN51_05245, partial [Gammaproteobacteria bacterium]